jgi:hypothetical protein
MVNLECQSNSSLFNDNQSSYLPKMSSSTNLHDYLTNNTPIKSLSKHNKNNNDDDSDNDLSIEINLITTISSASSDSAIVSDAIDDADLINNTQTKYRNSWPKMLEKPESIFTSFSKSFHLLNQFELQTTDDNDNLSSKYKRPLPWNNSIHQYTSSNKVSRD